MHRLRPRYLAHAILVSLLILTAAVDVTFPAVRAGDVPDVAVVESLPDSAGPRGILSTRAPDLLGAPERAKKAPVPTRAPLAITEPKFEPVPTPLPTPVPLPSPLPTPLPAPTPTPEPTPEPTPAPVQVFWPVPGGYISQYFTAGHPAVDIAAPCGTAAVAIWSGTVVFGGWKENGGGYVVDIQFDNGLVGSYNHLQAVYVAAGWVPAGSILGEVGMTGIATGCHLHLAMTSGGRFVDPLSFVAP